MINPFSKGIQWESANYLNKLFTSRVIHSTCYSFLNQCSQMCLSVRILDKSRG